MPGSTGVNLGLTYGWDTGEKGWGAPTNANWAKVDALMHLSVISATTVSSPGTPANGARYVVPVGGLNNFAGQDGNVAVRQGGAWVFHTPKAGWTCDAQDTGRRWRYDGAAWVDALATQPYLDVSNPSGWTMPNGTAWTRIQMFTKTTDTAAGWDAPNHRYLCPLSGIYMVSAMLRPVRTGSGAFAANLNLALGFGSESGDGVDVVSDSSQDLLDFTLQFNKPMALTAGTTYYIFGRHGSPTPIQFTFAQLKLLRIGAIAP